MGYDGGRKRWDLGGDSRGEGEKGRKVEMKEF